MNEKWRRRARLYWVTAFLSCALVVVVAWVLLGAGGLGWGLLPNAIVTGAAAVAAGGAVLVGGGFLVHKGLLVAPAKPAALRLEPRCIVLTDGSDELQVPLACVRGATFVFHDSFDGIRGIDDALRIHLTNGSDLLIASSTSGFDDVFTWLERGGRLAREGVGGGSP